MSAGMARDDVLALPVVVDLVTAGRAWGWSRSRVYEHHAAGVLPFPVVTVGGRYKVTREALLTSLGIDPSSTSNPAPTISATVHDMSGAGSVTDPAAATLTDGSTPRHARVSHAGAV